MNGEEAIRRGLVARGAWLIAISMVTGFWVALSRTKHIGDGDLALASHLNALIGGLWLIAVAWSFDYLHYGATGRQRLAWLLTLATWANWFVTLIASFLKVKGLEYNSDMNNNIIAFFLQTLVVLPAVAGALAWAWGFRRPT